MIKKNYHYWNDYCYRLLLWILKRSAQKCQAEYQRSVFRDLYFYKLGIKNQLLETYVLIQID